MKYHDDITPEQISTWVSNNFEYKFASGNNQIRICNPWDSDAKYKVYISLYKTPLKHDPDRIDYWVHDFRGYYNSSFIKFVMKYKSCSYGAAIKEITGQKKLKKLEKSIEKVEIKDVELPKYSKPLFTDDDNSKLKEVSLNYLSNRAITKNDVLTHKLYYTPTTIVFPYYEYDSLVFWQERRLISKEFNFPDAEKTGLRKTDYLFGFDNVEPNEDVIIVESIFNCMSVGDNCVATGGAVMAGSQPKKLRALLPDWIVLAPDNDKAGIISLESNFYLLRDKFNLAYCLPPDKDDWNDMDRKLGKGTARKYIEKNSKALNVDEITKMKL